MWSGTSAREVVGYGNVDKVLSFCLHFLCFNITIVVFFLHMSSTCLLCSEPSCHTCNTMSAFELQDQESSTDSVLEPACGITNVLSCPEKHVLASFKRHRFQIYRPQIIYNTSSFTLRLVAISQAEIGLLKSKPLTTTARWWH